MPPPGRLSPSTQERLRPQAGLRPRQNVAADLQSADPANYKFAATFAADF
jgi:hypothetical protein